MRKISIESLSLRLLYSQYKEYLIFIGIIVASFLLLVFFVIPQVEDFFSIQAEEERYKEKNTVLKNNIALINSLSDVTLDLQFRTATLAISTQKDYVGVMNTLSVAAERSGVTLGDFTVEVGDLSTASARVAESPSMEIDIQITGNTNTIHSFLNMLSSQLPLVKITTLQLNNTSAIIHTEFPYKPYVVGTTDTTRRFTPFSKQEEELLQKIQEWYSNVEGSASPSAF